MGRKWNNWLQCANMIIIEERKIRSNIFLYEPSLGGGGSSATALK